MDTSRGKRASVSTQFEASSLMRDKIGWGRSLGDVSGDKAMVTLEIVGTAWLVSLVPHHGGSVRDNHCIRGTILTPLHDTIGQAIVSGFRGNVGGWRSSATWVKAWIVRNRPCHTF